MRPAASAGSRARIRADTLNGLEGDDRFSGGPGNDTFVFAPNFGNDVIKDFDANPAGGQDRLDIAAFGVTSATFMARVAIDELGADTLVTIDQDSGSDGPARRHRQRGDGHAAGLHPLTGAAGVCVVQKGAQAAGAAS
jgi:Ca2+-binding RTX toxin-like protein